jgi:hypothetical protein
MAGRSQLNAQLRIRCGLNVPTEQRLTLSDPIQRNAAPPPDMSSTIAAYNVVGVDDLEPQSRDRSNTWPLRRPNFDTQTSPLIHEQIPEEDVDLYDSETNNDPFNHRLGASSAISGDDELMAGGSPGDDDDDYSPRNILSPTTSSAMLTTSDEQCGGGGGAKKSTTRRNAWGNMSYADLITQAITSSPEKRLTLSQVYEWMVQNVPYFRDKGDSNSSAGWKNSIRHNLSLHSRFMRIQNEGAGKSSWWVINPDAKPGRNPRRARERAATLETTTKASLEKKRGRVRKKLAETRGDASVHSTNSSIVGSQSSVISHDLYEDDAASMFRDRAHSNLSVHGSSSSHLSPSVDNGSQLTDDFGLPSWLSSAATSNDAIIPLVESTEVMRIDSMERNSKIIPSSNSSPYRGAIINNVAVGGGDYRVNGGVGSGLSKTGLSTSQIKVEATEDHSQLRPPPRYSEQQPSSSSYLVLNNVRPGQSNPLFSSSQQQPLRVPPVYYMPTNSYAYWNNDSGAYQQLPDDLANINLPEQSEMKCDVNALLHQELANGSTLDFDFHA